MDGPSPLADLADGSMDKLSGRIVVAYAQGLMIRAFPGNTGTRVGHMT